MDPWVGSTTYPPLMPTEWVCKRLALTADDESRAWTKKIGDKVPEVMWSRTWGEKSERDDESEREHGERLNASLSLVVHLLEETAMSLIIEVRIKRRAIHSRYERDRDYETAYPPPYTRYFLVNQHSEIWSL
jgi:hypothetical protein